MLTDARKEYFARLLEDIYPRLERFAMSICRSRDEAKDVVGETVLIAYERFDTLKDEKAFPAFLFTIVSRVRVTLYRKNRRHETTEPEVFDFIRSNELSPEDLTDIKILYSALDKLKAQIKEAVVLYDIIGLSYKEIATVQNSSLPAVKLRIHRGRKQLAKILGVENDIK